MPLTDFGVSFDPSQHSQTGQGAPGRLRNPVQEPVQTLNVRLPKVFGARAAVPRELMGGAGGMGQFGGGGSMIGQVLAMLAGIPQRPNAVSRNPPVNVQAPMMPGGVAGAPPPSRMTPSTPPMMTPPPVSMMTPPPMMPPPPVYNEGRQPAYNQPVWNDDNRPPGTPPRVSGGGVIGPGGGDESAVAYQQPSAAQLFSQQSAYQPASIFSAPLPVRVAVQGYTDQNVPAGYVQPTAQPQYQAPASWSSPYDFG